MSSSTVLNKYSNPTDESTELQFSFCTLSSDRRRRCWSELFVARAASIPRWSTNLMDGLRSATSLTWFRIIPLMALISRTAFVLLFSIWARLQTRRAAKAALLESKNVHHSSESRSERKTKTRSLSLLPALSNFLVHCCPSLFPRHSLFWFMFFVFRMIDPVVISTWCI